MRSVQEVVSELVNLGREHHDVIVEQTMVTNMLKARARRHLRFGLDPDAADRLLSGDGERLDKAELARVYKYLLDERSDPLFLARNERLLAQQEEAERQQARLFRLMGNTAKELPVHAWVEQQRGCSASMLGKIVSEAPGSNLNSLGDYETPAHVWKWFGLHVVDGHAPKRERGKKQGFSSYRRSVAYQLGEGLIRAGTRDGVAVSHWAAVYRQRKEYEIGKARAAGLVVLPAAKIKEGSEDGAMSEGHVHNRAKRYTEKLFLQTLWEQWCGVTGDRAGDRAVVAARSADATSLPASVSG